MSKLCTMLTFMLCSVLLIGCPHGWQSGTIPLDTQMTERAISYDGQIEVIVERTPTTVVKAIQHRSWGSETPQTVLVLLYECAILADGGEDCYPITDGQGNRVMYGASGSGLLNDVLTGIGSATVGAAGFYGGMRALRPATHTEHTSISGVSGSSSHTGDVDVDASAGAAAGSRSYSQSRAVNKPTVKNRAVIQQPPMMPGPRGND